MSKDNIGISMGGSEELFNRLKSAVNWVINRKMQVNAKNVTEGKQGIVLQQEKAYKQGYIDALDHVQKLLENLSAH
jgi:hypothetical protein